MDFAHPLRRSNPKPTAEEEVHSSGNKEETAGDVDDTAALLSQRWRPRNGVVVQNLVVVAGKLLIPAVSKLNTGRS
jgi:hypothetical protein